MLCKRKIVEGFDRHDFVAVGTEAVEIDAKGLRVARYINDLIDPVA